MADLAQNLNRLAAIAKILQERVEDLGLQFEERKLAMQQLMEVKALQKRAERKKLQIDPTIDDELELLKIKIVAEPNTRDSLTDAVYTGPRGGLYRINSSGRKSYDV
jgi:hypothetical protein